MQDTRRLTVQRKRFHTRKFIETLHNSIIKINFPFVLAIDGDWGSGKTHLIDTWIKLKLEPEKLPYVYFSAWDNDYGDDPFASIMSAIQTKFIQNNNKDRNTDYLSALATSAAKLGGKLIFHGAGAAVSAYARSKGYDIPENAPSTFFEKTASTITSISNDSVDFKTSLKIFAESEGEYWLSQNKNNTINTSPLLVIIIDELDRCRPDYAIKLLERVKHLFNVTNVVFIFTIAYSQLKHTISEVYGNIDTNSYLRRFFDHRIPFPKPTKIELEQFCKYICKESNIFNFTGENENNCTSHKLISTIASSTDMTLRDIKHAIHTLHMCMSINSNTNLYIIQTLSLFTLLVCIKIKSPDTFTLLQNGEAKQTDVLNTINIREIIKTDNYEESAYSTLSALHICKANLDPIDEDFMYRDINLHKMEDIKRLAQEIDSSNTTIRAVNNAIKTINSILA